MPETNSPSKTFQFRIEIDGLDQFEVQEANIPDLEVDVVEHGGANTMIKTAGMVKVGDTTLKKLRKMEAADNWAWDWISQVQNQDLGGGALPTQYKKTVVINQLSADGVTTIASWVLQGVFPKKVSFEAFTRTESANQLESVVLSVDKVKKIF
jgi:phage tail-like protein